MIRFKFILISASIINIEIISNLIPITAQTSKNIQLAGDPPPPPVTEESKDGRGSGTRSEFCENTKFDLKPIVPFVNRSFSGLTLKERPTFWFYVPYKSDSIAEGKFVLEDEEGNNEFRHFFKVPQTPGFVSFSMPMTEKPLVTNKQYRWSFTLFCSSKTSSEPKSDVSEGWVQRVDMANLETQLKTATLEERVKLYVENKIWYDAASDFANQENRKAWFNLLEAVGMQDLKQEPIRGSVVLVEPKPSL